MCAIFGMGFQWNTRVNSTLAKKVIRNLFTECMARGRTASGIAYVTSEEVKVFKAAVPGNELIRLPEYKTLEEGVLDTWIDDGKAVPLKSRPFFAMGHCRLKTKGTEEINKNNHPIVRDSVVGTHNGVIVNDDTLFARYYDKFDRFAGVDSEIIFALIEHYSKEYPIADAISLTTQEMSGGYACSMVHVSQPYVLWLFKNTCPCDVLHFQEDGVIVWASDQSYINKATKYLGILNPKIIHFPARTGLAIDFYRDKIFRFSLDSISKAAEIDRSYADYNIM